MGFYKKRTVAAALAALLLQACAATPPVEETAAVEPAAAEEPKRRWALQREETPETDVGSLLEAEGGETREPPPSVDRRGKLPRIATLKERPPRIQVSPKDDVVQLDYEQVELRQILEDVADALGITIVIDSSIADKVTLRTSIGRPLKHDDLWPLLRLLLSDAGVTMEKKGSVYHAKKAPSALPKHIGALGAISAEVGGEVMQITPLRFVTAASAVAVLKPMVEPGRIQALPNLNLLAITTSAEQLERVNHMLELVDSDAFVHRGVRLYPLSNAKAADVAKDLSGVIRMVEGENSAYQVLALDRINAVLVVSAPNRGFTEVERWIEILDSGDGEGGERIFIYRVKNLEAKSLASTLNQVFKQERKPARDADEESGDKKEKAKPADDKKKGKAAEKVAEAFSGVATAGAARRIRVGASTADIQVSIVADEDTNSLLVRAQPRDYKQLLETIAELDRVPQEVMINVLIAEVMLSETNRFGIEWKALSQSASSSLGVITGLAGDKAAGTVTGLIIDQADSRLTTLINMLDSDGDARVLSRPSILVRDNQEAVIKVGSEEPVLTRISSSDTTVSGSSTLNNDVQYRDTGIILTVTPHINEDGIINLDVHQEISQVGDEATELGLPRFTNREVKTSAVVRDGTVLILGGIIQTRTDDTRIGVPGLKEVPGIGALFSDRKRNLVRTELALIIVPELVDPREGSVEVMERVLGRLQGVARMLDGYGISRELGLN